MGLTAEQTRYLIDAAERVFWTLIQAAGGAVLDVITSGEITWRAVGYAALLAVVKVAGARLTGDRKTAQALPGGATYTNAP